MRKKLFSILLAITLLLTGIPPIQGAPVYAEEDVSNLLFNKVIKVSQNDIEVLENGTLDFDQDIDFPCRPESKSDRFI